jgi:hypothetical protein
VEIGYKLLALLNQKTEPNINQYKFHIQIQQRPILNQEKLL